MHLTFRRGLCLSVSILAIASPALAQRAPAAAAVEAEHEVDELVVNASRQIGAVAGDIKPEIQLNARDIRAYGVSSVSELITALAPQTTSGRGSGMPVILVNGQRISSFAEIRDVPTEAILRVDILPEEVSLKYGYRADQRVVNLVLRPRFRAITAEGSAKASTEGAGEIYSAELTRFRNLRDQRTLLNAKVSKTNPVLESDRDIANTRGDARFRSLTAESASTTLSAVVSRPVREGVSGTLNVQLDGSRNENLLGLPLGANLAPGSVFALAPASALKRQSDAVAGHLGGGMNGAIKGWSWSLTGNVDRSDTTTTTDRSVGGVAFTDKSRSMSQTADANLVLSGVVTRLPAGSVSTTLKVGASTADLDTRSLRSGVGVSGSLSRDIGTVQASLDVPLTNRAKGVLEGVGDLSLNLNGELDRYSDFGTLALVGGGLNWTPVSPLRLIASITQEEGAPTVSQLGAPVQVTAGVRVFDFRTGQTVEVTRVEGGTRGLSADNRNVLKLGGTWKPLQKTDLSFTANYVRTEIKDVIASFPTASNQIEAAFPERFTRDAAGNLIRIDSRPINFDRRTTEEIRWGFTYRRPIGPEPPAGGFPRRPDGPDGGGPPPGGFGGGGPGGPGRFGGPRFGGGRGGNLQIGLYHTIRLEDSIRIRPGVPVLDLLGGGAIGNSGGTSRHQVDLQTNLSKNGYGLSMNGRWQSGSTVVGSAVGDLRFDDLTTINLRLFADLGMQPWARTKYPWLRGARVSLGVDNLFNARQQVRSSTGVAPINFQPDYLDPLGRQVRISFRKLFF